MSTWKSNKKWPFRGQSIERGRFRRHSWLEMNGQKKSVNIFTRIRYISKIILKIIHISFAITGCFTYILDCFTREISKQYTFVWSLLKSDILITRTCPLHGYILGVLTAHNCLVAKLGRWGNTSKFEYM